MAVVTLETPKEIIEQVETKRLVSSFEVLSVKDNRIKKEAIALVKLNSRNNPKEFILWSGSAWDAIGAYSDEQVDNRVLELINTL